MDDFIIWYSKCNGVTPTYAGDKEVKDKQPRTTPSMGKPAPGGGV